MSWDPDLLAMSGGDRGFGAWLAEASEVVWAWSGLEIDELTLAGGPCPLPTCRRWYDAGRCPIDAAEDLLLARWPSLARPMGYQ